MSPSPGRLPRGEPRAEPRVFAFARASRRVDGDSIARYAKPWQVTATCGLALAFALGSGGTSNWARLIAPNVEAATRTVETPDAETVIAAFLYNFAARHVRWPSSAHDNKTSPFVLGVLGDDPIVKSLIDTCRGRKSGAHPLVVRVLDDVEDAAWCHLVYLPEERTPLLEAVIKACNGRPILIVGSTEQSVRDGAVLGFFVEKSKIRIAADPVLAKERGLEISSELLKLSRVVEHKDER